jgi:phenylalanyl-tRNA synthetase beta subunit
VAFNLSLRAEDRTLTDEDIAPVVEKILSELATLGAQLR